MPTPQQSFNHPHPHQLGHPHMPPAMSPQGPASQPNALSYGSAHPYPLSFDASQQSLSQPTAPTYSQSFSNGPVSNAGGYARSFGEGMQPMRGYAEKPSIYTAVYSGVSVYEMEIGGVACMRRRSDGWLNATQILKVAGVDKGKRTKVLEKEILTGEHEKVQGGYGKYQGTWISYQRGREFCRQYGVEDILRPLLEYDVQADGSGGHSQDTPTKEQALAAQRKRYYASGQEPRPNGPVSNGTFFSNISPSASVALAAMNKAARLNSPAPRPPSVQRPASVRRPSEQDGLTGSQRSVRGETDTKSDSGYGTHPNGSQGEPPRKRMRRDDSQDGMAPPIIPLDASIRSNTPTEPNESFLYENALMQDSVNENGDPIALAPLPNASTEEQQEKLNLILDLFAEQGRNDYASHPALTQLSNEDFNLPLDASCNNALHWAATLAKAPLLKLLIQKGANVWRGNAAGQSPLVSAVLVSNCWEHSCFPEILELLGPLIEVRDIQGRTILHHIGVSSGIKGRAPSSKYYLEALLEFLVRTGTRSDATGGAQAAAVAMATMQQGTQQTNGDSSSQDSNAWGKPRGPVSLSRFLSHVVNARDKAGNTALNLVSRIGNRSIIHQLLEIHADPRLPNNKGLCARDFGAGLEPGESPYQNGIGLTSQLPAGLMQRFGGAQDTAATDGNAMGGATTSQVEELGQDVIASMTSMLTQNLASHKELLRNRTEQIDRLNEQIRELSTLQKTELEKLLEMKERMKQRSERRAKIGNLKREVETRRANLKRSQTRKNGTKSPKKHVDLTPDWMRSSFDVSVGSLPSVRDLRRRMRAYATGNKLLEAQADLLHSRSIELEAMYRKVVSLCTGVEENKVEESLPALVAAIESEKGALGTQEVGRVRDFLRRVDEGPAKAVDISMQDEYDGPTLMINPTVTAAAARAEAARRMAGRVRG